MNLKFIVLLITGGVMYNTYHDNFLVNHLKTKIKYYKMAAIAVFGIGLFLVMSRNPNESWSTMNAVKNYIHVLPIDRQAKDLIKPFLEKNEQERSIEKINTSSRTHKRSVSETKKKYIASQQNWKCKQCHEQLTAWFEVDHIKRLDQGGTNDVQNLVALCRNCHGEKTSMENI
jgi:5-methylcytosine-specific restriction endonuclease McrA